jgi:hypothetical protein
MSSDQVSHAETHYSAWLTGSHDIKTIPLLHIILHGSLGHLTLKQSLSYTLFCMADLVT